jgi:class 3 adenylate cyclase
LICCLLAVEIADYDAKPVFDQVRLTQDFHNLLFDTTEGATSHDLVSMVGEDGALLGFLADPEECFATALTIRQATLTQDRYRDLPLRIGINLGRAQIAEDEFGHPHVSGEGRQDADRLMHQGPPGQISVARQFVELLSRAAPELAELLEDRGLYSDNAGPPLYLYRVSAPQDDVSERPSDQPRTPTIPSGVIDAPTQSGLEPSSVPAPPTTMRRNWLRRSWLGYALLPLLAGAAMVTLSSRFRVEAPTSRPPPQLAAATPQITATAPVALPASVLPEEMTRSAVMTPAALANDPRRPRPAASLRAKPTTEVAHVAPPIEERALASFNSAVASEELLVPDRSYEAEQPTEVERVQDPRSATLLLAVKPWGEVYVDGRKVGVTPPLKSFDVPIGRHLITITNSSLPTYQREVTVEPDTKITVAHDFTCVSTREKICREGFGKGLKWRSRLETAEVAHPQ